MAEQFGDAWHLGPITQTGLTEAHVGAPNVRATGGVSVTPAGRTQVTLVSLSRLRARGLVNFTTANLARLTLVYAPEPSVVALLAGGAAALAWIGWRRQRAARH